MLHVYPLLDIKRSIHGLSVQVALAGGQAVALLWDSEQRRHKRIKISVDAAAVFHNTRQPHKEKSLRSFVLFCLVHQLCLHVTHVKDGYVSFVRWCASEKCFSSAYVVLGLGKCATDGDVLKMSMRRNIFLYKKLPYSGYNLEHQQVLPKL